MGLTAIVVADGDPPDRAALDATWPDWESGAALIVAADGGARTAANLGLAIDLIVGDGDSLGDAELDRHRRGGTEILVAPVAKDESDTELAVLAALDRGAGRIVIVGALGGSRFDHALANIGLLGHPRLSGCDVAIVDPAARITLLEGPATRSFDGRPGDLVSLLPFGGDARDVTTAGLRFPLNGEPLTVGPARGLSNERLGSRATVSVGAGRLLVVEVPATVAR